MDKRGEAETLELSMLFEILIGLAVAGFLIMAALSWNSLSNFNKVYVEEDLQLLSNSLLSSPSEITYNYPLSSNLKVEMSPNTVKVVSSPGFFALTEESNLVLDTSHKSNSINVRRVANA